MPRKTTDREVWVLDYNARATIRQRHQRFLANQCSSPAIHAALSPGKTSTQNSDRNALSRESPGDSSPGLLQQNDPRIAQLRTSDSRSTKSRNISNAVRPTNPHARCRRLFARRIYPSLPETPILSKEKWARTVVSSGLSRRTNPARRRKKKRRTKTARRRAHLNAQTEPRLTR